MVMVWFYASGLKTMQDYGTLHARLSETSELYLFTKGVIVCIISIISPCLRDGILKLYGFVYNIIVVVVVIVVGQ